MKRYQIIAETIEARTADVISAAYDQGLQNGNFKVLLETESLEEARKALAKHTISVSSFRTAGGKRYSAVLVYIEAFDYDEDIEEWESDLDSLEFATVANPEANEE